jgi:hypothetical protein
MLNSWSSIRETRRSASNKMGLLKGSSDSRARTASSSAIRLRICSVPRSFESDSLAVFGFAMSKGPAPRSQAQEAIHRFDPDDFLSPLVLRLLAAGWFTGGRNRSYRPLETEAKQTLRAHGPAPMRSKPCRAQFGILQAGPAEPARETGPPSAIPVPDPVVDDRSVTDAAAKIRQARGNRSCSFSCPGKPNQVED